jgi:hypothetical protein
MQPTRLFYEDTPAFIPVPAALHHCRSEVIVWPLDNAATEEMPEAHIPQNVQSAAAARPSGLANDRGVPVPDDFFAPLPDELMAAFNGGR